MFARCKFTTKFYVLLRLTIIFIKSDYSLPSVEAMGGVIWKKNAGDFVQIYSIKSFDKINKQRISLSRELETHNFNGKKLKFTSFPIKNLVEFIANDKMVTGVHGDTWQLLSNMFNFQLAIIKLNEPGYGMKMENGSWNGLMGYVYRNETDIIPRTVVSIARATILDYTTPTWRTPYRFCMKKQLQYDKSWMTQLFSKKLWYFIIGIFAILTITSFTIHWSKIESKIHQEYLPNIGDHVFYTFSIFCNQGWIPSQLEKRSKIFLLSIRLFCWLLIIAFSSKLIAHITERHINLPFKDIVTLYENTDYNLIVKRSSFVYSVMMAKMKPVYDLIIRAGRLKQGETEDSYVKMCTGKYVYVEAQDVVEADNFNICEINYASEPWLNVWIAGGMVRGFKYTRTMDIGILKLHEFGLIKRLKLKWLTKVIEIRTSNESVAITLEHVSLMLTLLCCAVILSLVILLIENLTHLNYRRRRQRRQKYNQQHYNNYKINNNNDNYQVNGRNVITYHKNIHKN